MAELSPVPIELRAGMDKGVAGLFFYLAYNPKPASSAIAKSLVNEHSYKHFCAQSNEDGSATLQFFRNTFNLMDDTRDSRERVAAKKRIRFQEFITDCVVPQLMEATDCEVNWSGELAIVEVSEENMSLFVSTEGLVGSDRSTVK